MKKLFLALALCAFVAAPALADNHGHATTTQKEETVKTEEHADAPVKAAPATKKKKRTAKKVTTQTTEEAAPAEPTHN